MSAKAGGAYGGATTTTGSERKTWDKAAYDEKARQKDAEYAERAREREEAMKKGKKAPRRKEVLPKATKLLEAREEPLGLDKNLNKTIVVASGRPGFSCETCKRTLKDSASYLDHVNGRYHLRKLGQMTKVKRSTLQEVQARIQELREQSQKRMEQKQYNFQQRLKELKELEDDDKKARKEQKKLEKQREEERRQQEAAETADPEMMAMMGFSGFS